jgi:hypothetical protein
MERTRADGTEDLMVTAPSWQQRLGNVLARLVAALILGGFLALWGAEWGLSPLALAPLTGLFGLFPLGIVVFRRNRLAGILSWLLLGLNLAGALCWALFQWDSRGPLLGLDLVVLIAAGCGPSWNKRWLVALGCGLASGLGAVLALWGYSFILYFPGILDLPFGVNAMLLGAGAGLVGEVLRRSVERGARDPLRAQLLPNAGLSRGAQGLSRRQVLFGLGGVMGLAATGVGATWLMRTVLPHFRPLVSFQSEWGAITTLSWSPDGQQIVSAAFSQEVSIWNAATGGVLQTADQYTQINAVAWSPDGRQVAIGVSSSGENQAPNVFLTAPATLEPQMRLRAADGLVWSVAWSPDSTRLAIATIHAQVWEATTGKVLWTTSGFAWRAAWSPNGAYLATADSDGTCQIWEASSGRLLMTYHGHTDAVNAVAWSPDSRLLASGGADATVHVWESLTGRQVYAYLGHRSPFLGPTSVDTVAWSPDGQRIASSGIDGAIHVWGATTGDRVFVYAGQEGPVNVVAWSPDGQRIASGGVRGIVQVWQPG